MKYSIIALSALFAAGQATLEFTNSEFNVKPGRDFPLTCNNGGCASRCTITLMRGPNRNDMKPVKVVGEGVGMEFTITPSADWPAGPLAFKITNTVGEENWSLAFPFEGTGAVDSGATDVASSSPAVSTAIYASALSSGMASSAAAEVTASVSSIPIAVATPGQSSLINSSSSTTSMSAPPRNLNATSGSNSAGSSSSSVPTSGVDRVSASLALVAGIAAVMAYFN
ncbi:hypothetical protein HRG_008090 [Hirsutella rhossiliensis]|uniref:GPI anchored protein n=1 Tax=Hirsutella rhossiliensis TaxID=111463 RepID=A0A9P8MTS4_9HYPO|nr:uncharacterized protein HRG_08090 [Hirsutella rhossiliensis]KAH0960937.1 hypothetical protein HRG_08090 [Hirsutella rhossiliensis]